MSKHTPTPWYLTASPAGDPVIQSAVINGMKQKLIKLYLDYVNNFLTVAGFASYYGMEVGKALRVIRVGRALHEAGVQKGAT